ncbi:hypothetical protein C8R46DRAFT_138293 [Mycena filopes]|nr:hypothetical protein C8R46DRAFT_138293 [Mycena filopes]
MSLTIPIPVKKRGQRTLKIVGFGLKALLTTRVSGKLVIRKKTPADEGRPPPQTGSPWQKTSNRSNPQRPTRKLPVPRATDWAEDAHKNCVSHGIKARDFAYPATRVGHTNPFHRRPMTLSEEEREKLGKEKAKEIASTPVTAPMPSVAGSWEVPHPSLRPVARPPAVSPKVPTPQKPFSPFYETHRIPVPFDQGYVLAVVIYRLAENPRTVPIRGSFTRRLLTLSPDMIDLSQYAEMDLEELRRYDRSIVWRLQHGIEPHPWYTVADSAWVPNANERALLLATYHLPIMSHDHATQSWVIDHATWEFRQDNLWQKERLEEARREHELARGEEDRDFTLLKHRTWMRRRASDQDSKWSSYMKAKIPLMLRDDWAANAGEGDNELDEVEMTKREVDPYEGVKPPWPLVCPPKSVLKVGPYWGPNNVWDRYRLYGGVPTGKTLGEYLAEMSSRVDDGSPWPLPRPLKRKRGETESDGEVGEDEDAAEEEEGSDRKRARTESIPFRLLPHVLYM